MVDITLLQSVSYMAGALGVFIAAIFYVLNLRISQRNMKQTLETRQAQFYMQIYNHLTSEDSQRRWIDAMNMEWRDYDEYEKKYGSDEHPEIYAKRYASLYEFGGVGYLLKKGLIDRDTAYSLAETQGLWLWRKFESMVREQRVRYNTPESFSDLEYLAAET
ncbi:MAG: hypothetical protein NTY03_02470, partial [Candidatus Bathyarchaeota archaeon]|nr:hypothetical protein [Candidatus Bathyarchaeota archaeon]